MQVTVKTLDSETRVFTVDDEATVDDFKKQIASEVSIPAERQRLIFRGKVLQDSSSLSSYGVDGCVVHLVERKPPSSSRTDGESSSRSTSHHGAEHAGDGHGFPSTFNHPTEVMNISQQIVQGLMNQLGLDSAQANVSTSQSGDGSTLNVHINLLASANGNASDAGLRISKARQFLRAARNSLNRAEEEGVLPSPMDTSTPPREADSRSSTEPQRSSDSQSSQRQNQNGSPSELADVLGELQEMNAILHPILARYSTLLRSSSTEDLLPSDDNLPDRVAETLHNLSHAYHALSDLTYNFRSPEPRHLNVLPPLSGHMGASPFLSTLFPGMQNPGSQNTQQGSTSVSGSGSRVHIVPAIAFTSVITSSMPRVTGNNHNTPPTSGPDTRTNQSPGFMFNFGSPGNGGSHGNQGSNGPQRTSASSGTSTTSTSSGTRTTASRSDSVRFVMDDIVALLSNSSNPVTSHSETSRTSTATPSPGRSNGDSQTQTQNSGTTGTSRVIPRIGLGSLPLNSSHHDPLVPCESFHFGPRAHQPQGTQGAQEQERTQEDQTSRESTQESQNEGLPQSFSDMIASMMQGASARPSQTSSQGTATRSDTSDPLGSAGQIAQTLIDLLARTQDDGSTTTTGGSESEEQSGQRRPPSGPPLDLDILQNIVMSSIGEASSGQTGSHQSINDFINQLPQGGAELNASSDSILEGPLLNKLVERFGMVMSLQDIVFIMLGLSEPYVRVHRVLREYLNNDLLNGEQATDQNIQRVSIDIAAELVNGMSESLTSVPTRDDIDITASMQSYLEHSIQRALIMARELDEMEFAAQFPGHVQRSCTDLCILLIICLRDGLEGAETIIVSRLPSFTLTRGVHPMIMRSFQMTVLRNLNTANSLRPEREESLNQFVKRKEAKKEENIETPAAEKSSPSAVDNSEDNSQHSDDSEAFATPPASLSANDIDEDKHITCPEENAMELDGPEDNEEWKTIVPEDWVPIITRDVIRQRRVPQQAPFSDAYLSGLPPKRRKTADQRAICPTEENIPSFLRQAVLAAGVTPRTSMEAVTTEARQSNDLQGAFREEVKNAVRTRTDKDTDYSPNRFPNTKDYLEK